MKQSAVGWIIDQLFELRNPTLNQIEIVKKAREIEKQQQNEFAIEFLKWVVSSETSDLLHDLEIVGEIDNNITPEKLLEIYKKEKGL